MTDLDAIKGRFAQILPTRVPDAAMRDLAADGVGVGIHMRRDHKLGATLNDLAKLIEFVSHMWKGW